MKKLLLTVLVAASVCACTKDLENRVDTLEKKVVELEEKINTNADGLSKLAAAAEKAVTVTSVETLSDGYVIHFSDGTKATIKNGTNGTNGVDGKDGHSPVIGMKEEGGVLYWTVDGEYILNNGNKVPVTGKDGVDGKTPQFKLENGVWKVSFDGQDWNDVPVTGTVEPKLVMTETDTEYVFTLGEVVIKIAKEKAFAINVDASSLVFDASANKLTVKYTVLGEDATTHVSASSSNLTVFVDEYAHSVYVTLPDGAIKGDILLTAVRNSDSKYSAQHVTVINEAYGSHGGKIVVDDNEYTEW